MKKSKRFLFVLLAVTMVLTNTAMAKTETKRTDGTNRYDTAIKLNEEYFKESSTAVVASGEGFADALVAGVLAGYENAPLYLTSKDRLSDELINSFRRSGIDMIYILGGENSLSFKIEDQLNRLNFGHARFWGESRYETAREVAEFISKNHKITGPTYYADGNNFPDALAAAPMVVKNRGLLLLNDASKKPNFKASDVALGGENSVPGRLNRISGDNRYITALEIAKKARTDRAILVDGTNFPDALAAGALACQIDANIILTSPSNLPSQVVDFIKDYKEAFIVGGENSVSRQVEEAIRGSQIPVEEKGEEKTQEDKKDQYVSYSFGNPRVTIKVPKDLDKELVLVEEPEENAYLVYDALHYPSGKGTQFDGLLLNIMQFDYQGGDLISDGFDKYVGMSKGKAVMAYGIRELRNDYQDKTKRDHYDEAWRRVRTEILYEIEGAE